jgi:hypothetical protein
MFFEYGGAVVCFAVPRSRNIARWLIGKPNSVLELARLWSPDGHAPNLLTKALSAAIKKLRRDHPQCEAIVSYADPNAGHNATVYRAASWVDLGPITETRYYGDATGKPVSGAGYITEENAQLKRRFARGLTRSARRQIAAKASHING